MLIDYFIQFSVIPISPVSGETEEMALVRSYGAGIQETNA